MKVIRFALAAAALWIITAPAAAKDESCGIYPPKVQREALWSNWSGCKMKRNGELAIWDGLPDGIARVTRFVFTDGHGLFYRAVTISELPGGKGLLRLSGTNPRRKYRQPETLMTRRRIRLTKDDIARINRLGADTGTWEFDVGSWDGDELFMHCQLLEMERADATGYRYSSVNIGCNQPSKLMPLIDEVVRLAKLRRHPSGQLFY